MARPKKEIDEHLIRRLAAIHCSNVEIAAVVGVDESTIRRRFAETINQYREAGKTSLRRLMWRRAKAGSDRALQMLSDRMLGPVPKLLQHITPRELEVVEKIVRKPDPVPIPEPTARRMNGNGTTS